VKILNKLARLTFPYPIVILRIVLSSCSSSTKNWWLFVWIASIMFDMVLFFLWILWLIMMVLFSLSYSIAFLYFCSNCIYCSGSKFSCWFLIRSLRSVNRSISVLYCRPVPSSMLTLCSSRLLASIRKAIRGNSWWDKCSLTQLAQTGVKYLRQFWERQIRSAFWSRVGCRAQLGGESLSSLNLFWFIFYVLGLYI